MQFSGELYALNVTTTGISRRQSKQTVNRDPDGNTKYASYKSHCPSLACQIVGRLSIAMYNSMPINVHLGVKLKRPINIW